jgi:hypothetical protein
MPVEIKELQIKVTVNQGQNQQADQSNTTNNSSKNEDDKDAIIQQCIEQVFEIMNNKKER